MTRAVLPSVVVLMVTAHVLLLRTADGVAATSNFPEDPCLREGGLCALKSACPPGKLHSTMGLCPRHQVHGVECCMAVPNNIKDCRRRGGECLPKETCHGPKDSMGLCQAGNVCCVML